ncbi:MAG TPA: TIM barrel protein [Bacteroidales bacterium]|nr:TIM barrel protein [Bacteroidales bacterium]
METGLSSYTYTWAVGVAGSMPQVPLKAEDIIDKAFNAGLGIVQIADNIPLEKWPVEQLKVLRSYAEHKNVRIEMGGRGMMPDHTLSCLMTAEILGSPILRMVIDGHNFEPEIQDISAIIRDLLPEFKSRNIKLAIENHDRLKAREFEKIILNAGSDLVGICLDSVNSMGAGEGFEEVSGILIPYTINFHVKDFSVRRLSHKMGIIIEGTPAGKGMLNIKEIVDKLEEDGKCETAILELWTPPEENIERTIVKENLWAQESIEYLKKIIN